MRIRWDAPGKRGHPFFTSGMLKFILENGILEVPHKARKGFRQRKKGSLCKAVVSIWQQNFMQ